MWTDSQVAICLVQFCLTTWLLLPANVYFAFCLNVVAIFGQSIQARNRTRGLQK